MLVNAIAPWEGKLVWVGTPSGGFTQSGEEWKAVDFVLSYTDGRMQEKNICLNAFGVDKVNRLVNMPVGTMLRVVFSPTAREYNGKWFGKNEVFGISVVQPQAQPAQPQQYAPQGGTMMPPQAPVYQQPTPQYQQPAPAPQPVSPAFNALVAPDDDIPF